MGPCRWAKRCYFRWADLESEYLKEERNYSLSLDPRLNHLKCQPANLTTAAALSNVEQLSSARLTDDDIGNGRDLKPSLLTGADVGTATRSGAELVCLQNGL